MCARACGTLLLLAALPALTGRWWAAECEVVSVVEGRGVSGGGGATPAFVGAQETSVTVARGQTAALDCQVLRLGDNTVSWVRARDLQILSFAGAVFTADARVAAAARRGARLSHHTLSVRDLRPDDSGRYECQVNTEPKLSLIFNLTVIDEEMPSLVVVAVEREVWGAAGGAATLACEARYEPEPRALRPPPPAVRWERGGAPLDAGATPRALALDTQRWAARAVSRLTLLRLEPADAGPYACSAGDPPRTATITLRIRSPDTAWPLEAMQRDQSASHAAGALPPRALLALLALALAALAAL